MCPLHHSSSRRLIYTLIPRDPFPALQLPRWFVKLCHCLSYQALRAILKMLPRSPGWWWLGVAWATRSEWKFPFLFSIGFLRKKNVGDCRCTPVVSRCSASSCNLPARVWSDGWCTFFFFFFCEQLGMMSYGDSEKLSPETQAIIEQEVRTLLRVCSTFALLLAPFYFASYHERCRFCFPLFFSELAFVNHLRHSNFDRRLKWVVLSRRMPEMRRSLHLEHAEVAL